MRTQQTRHRHGSQEPSSTGSGDDPITSEMPVLADGRVIYTSDPTRNLVITGKHRPPDPPPNPHDVGKRLVELLAGIGLLSAASVAHCLAAMFAPLVVANLARGIVRPLYLINGATPDSDGDQVVRVITGTITSRQVPTLHGPRILTRSPTGQLHQATDLYAALAERPAYLVVRASGIIDSSATWSATPGRDVEVTERRQMRRIRRPNRAALLVVGDGLRPVPELRALCRPIDVGCCNPDAVRAVIAAQDELRGHLIGAIATYCVAGTPRAAPVSSRTADADGLLGGLLEHIGVPSYGGCSTPEELAGAGVVEELAALLAACAATAVRPVGAYQLYEAALRARALPRCAAEGLTEGTQRARLANWLIEHIGQQAGGYLLRGDRVGGAKAYRYVVEHTAGSQVGGAVTGADDAE